MNGFKPIDEICASWGMTIQKKSVRRAAHFAIYFVVAALLSISWAWFAGFELAVAAETSNPIADYWRKVREGISGYSAVTGQETDILIQGAGQNWRQLRNGPVATIAAWLIAATVFALGFFFLWRGKVKLTQPRTGEMVSRWSISERLLHWYTALLFIGLAITGLSLMFGRAVVIPLVGHENFALFAEYGKLIHNYAGPLFIVGLLLMIVSWLQDNIPNKIDIEWFKAFGGLVGSEHPSAERMNGGEKAWFWLLSIAGIGVSISGLALDFPNLGTERVFLQLSHLVHTIAAALLIVGALGHIYIGTIGTEGAFEGMVSGKVDSAWAKQHHDLWLEEINNQTETVDNKYAADHKTSSENLSG